MAISRVKAVFQSDLETVWETVTSLSHYGWRSDLSRIEILNETQFVEYAKNGFPTTFTVTLRKPCERWEFDLENDNIKGHWTGVFTRQDGQTVIEFTEDVTPKKFLLRPFVKAFLRKQQAQYISDLKKTIR